MTLDSRSSPTFNAVVQHGRFTQIRIPPMNNSVQIVIRRDGMCLYMLHAHWQSKERRTRRRFQPKETIISAAESHDYNQNWNYYHLTSPQGIGVHLRYISVQPHQLTDWQAIW